MAEKAGERLAEAAGQRFAQRAAERATERVSLSSAVHKLRSRMLAEHVFSALVSCDLSHSLIDILSNITVLKLVPLNPSACHTAIWLLVMLIPSTLFIPNRFETC